MKKDARHSPAPGHNDAMEMAEAARQQSWEQPSFLAELFMGRFHPEILFPFPEQDPEDRKIGDQFLARLEAFLQEHVDPDEVDRTGEIPGETIQGLIDLGCFRMKIPAKYGGLGFSQTNYNRAIAMVASYCGSTAVWMSAHQSIGAPQPLKLFGTDEQKAKYLPRLANGAISAFALTEPEVGSDPAQMQTTATPSEDGEHFILNGEKLWCTNGLVADIMVVMARTPSKWIDGKEKKQITAFIVDGDSPGIEVVHRCDFLGIRAIQNGVLRFSNVRVPRENILWGEGKGLKLALVTLNTGRLTLPAASAGMARQCLRIAREWANERSQWGQSIGKHEAVAAQIADIAATTFAMDAVSSLASSLADLEDTDIRLEAAMAKLFCTEATWRIVDETLQVRGGRGYETAPSLKARGEKGYPVERMLRDARINRIIEGTSEIMRLFIAREALDGHMRIAGDMLKPEVSFSHKLATFAKAGLFYLRWYPARWLPLDAWPRFAAHGTFARHLRFISRTSRRLARRIFHAMALYQARLEKKQALLGRVVDIGADLFAMAATISMAESLLRQRPDDRTPAALADLFCRQAERRIQTAMRAIFHNDDLQAYRVARSVLEGDIQWLEEGIVHADFSPEATRPQPVRQIKPKPKANRKPGIELPVH